MRAQAVIASLHAEQLAKRAAEVAEETRVAVERERAKLQAEAYDLPVVSFICLLKYVATADRQFTIAEKKALLASVQELFPGRWSDESVNRWIESAKATDSPASYAQHLAGDLRPRAWALIQGMATADGKATPAETRRLKEVETVMAI